MSSRFETAITIKETIDNIDCGDYLLPAIQRKFVWSSEQIEVLFDSIMRGYPINSFMFWEVKTDEIKNKYNFYRFLTDYREFFKEENPEIDTKAYRPFRAVIDGQQRLTSLYIGIKGSYAYKLPNKKRRDKEENIPTRHLYLNLSSNLSEDDEKNERQLYYDFQFFTEKEKKLEDPNVIWFKVNNILKYEDAGKLEKFMEENGWLSKEEFNFAKGTLRELRRVIFDKELINYYLEKTQDIEKVLDIFIRANSGGKPLSQSDLLMSFMISKWDSSARNEIPKVVKDVFAIGDSDFEINQDFVLKTCLVLFNEEIKYSLKNFEKDSVLKFEQNWGKIRKCIIETFTLFSNLGFNNHSLRAKNAAIPIIYYIYYCGIENEINNPNKYNKDKQLIRKWLCLSLLKGVFGGQSDNVLKGIRNAIKEELADKNKQPNFPLNKIKEEFKGTNKSLLINDDDIDELLKTEKDDSKCFPFLSLIYSHLNYSTQVYHKDHLHPANYFVSLKQSDIQDEEDFKFYIDRTNWNSILNLQLLNEFLNKSKQDTPLKDWVIENKIDLTNQLIPDVSLDIADFKIFLEERKKILVERLKEMIT